MDTQATKQPKKRRWVKWLISLVIIAIVVAGGGFYFQQQQSKKAFAKDIAEARRLVLYNPLVTSGAAQKLQNELPGTGDKTTDAQLEKRLNHDAFKKLLGQAKTQMAKVNDDELAKQEAIAKDAQKKLKDTQAKKNFDKDQNGKVETLIDMSNTYFQDNDAIGLNVTNTMMNQFTGEQTKSLQKKTAKQTKLADAVKDGTYPSLGAYRADLPFHLGVVLLTVVPGGPADNSGIQLIGNDTWDDSNVITGINDYQVQTAINGTNSMENVMKQIPLNSTASIKLLDGSTKTVKLDLAHNQAVDRVKEEFLPAYDHYGDDSDLTASDLGLSGYAYGPHVHEKTQIGYFLTNVANDSLAYKAGLRSGDVICMIDDYGAGSETDVNKDLSHHMDFDTISVHYVSKDHHLKTTDIDLSDIDDD